MATSPVHYERPAALSGHQHRVREHVLSEELFRGALVRERKRADRSREPIVLLLLKLDARTITGWLLARAAILGALNAAKGETDVLGWFEQQTTLGLLATHVHSLDQGFASALEAHVRRELTRRVDAETLSRFSIQVHVHQDSTRPAAHSMRPVDPLLEDAKPREGQRLSYDMAKRAVDLCASLALLTILAPLFLVIGALIKLTSSGPIFFRQERVGHRMKPFTILKFRTMKTNVSHAIHHEFVTSFIKSGEQAQEAGRKGLFKIANDPRVTSVGRILRKTSLDELPQLWNVVRGDMSLVGPRPPLQYEVAEYQPWHRRRVLEAKPGITGLWQVSGRSRTTFDDMVRLDLRYAKVSSLWTDIKILLATPAAVIAGKGAV